MLQLKIKRMKNIDLLTSNDKLTKIQEMILDCANHSAHHVSAPLARIKGLSNLYRAELSCQNKDELVHLISENADELSVAIKAFNKMLDNCLCSEKISRYQPPTY